MTASLSTRSKTRIVLFVGPISDVTDMKEAHGTAGIMSVVYHIVVIWH